MLYLTSAFKRALCVSALTAAITYRVQEKYSEFVDEGHQVVTYRDFLDLSQKGEFKEIAMQGHKVWATNADGREIHTVVPPQINAYEQLNVSGANIWVVPEKKYPLIKDSINPLFWPAVVGFGFGYGFLRVGGKLEEIWSRAKGVILKPKSEDLYRTAVHEAGHAVLLFLCPSNERIKRATINPVGSYLGCVFSKHTRPNSNLEELKNKIIILFGGRAAEQEIFNNFDTGSVSDLAKASNIARDIVTQYGMSEEIGPVQIPIYHTNSSFFENEKEKINNTVKTILEECLQKARQILNENKTILEAVAQALMQKRTLSHDQIEKIITKMRSSVSLENKPT